MKSIAKRRPLGVALRRGPPKMSRPVLLLIALGGATAAGLWLGWPAMVAAGVAPILIGLAPCAVMCALGLCVGGMGRRALRQPLSPEDQRPPGNTAPVPVTTLHADAGSRAAMPCCDAPAERGVQQTLELSR